MRAFKAELGRIIPRKWILLVKLAPFLALLVAAKLGIDLVNAGFLELTTLMGSMVAAAVFLLGFLLAGTLADYKESERLPGELASSLESLADECSITIKNKGAPEAEAAFVYVSDLASAIHRWFYREERTKAVMERISGLNDIFLAFEPLTQPNFIVRMKQEQSNIRRVVMRIDSIRDTSFVSAAYTIAELAAALVIAGLLFTDVEPFYAALFYVVTLGSLMIYLILLIHDLDDPFSYSADQLGAADVSIKLIADLDEKLASRADALRSAAVGGGAET